MKKPFDFRRRAIDEYLKVPYDRYDNARRQRDTEPDLVEIFEKNREIPDIFEDDEDLSDI